MRVEVHGHGLALSNGLSHRCEEGARHRLAPFARRLRTVTIRLETIPGQGLVRCHVLVRLASGGFAVGETGHAPEAALDQALARVAALLGQKGGRPARSRERGPSYSYFR